MRLGYCGCGADNAVAAIISPRLLLLLLLLLLLFTYKALAAGSSRRLEATH
jgi:hypothetical protein